MSDWLEALRVASESTAIDLVTAGALDEIRHALVVGRLVDREFLRDVAYLDGDGAWKIDLEQLGGFDEK